MKISQKIIEKILNDNVFSIELAKRLGNQQQSILGLARRNSRNLTLWEAGKLYKEQGFTMKFTKNNYLRKTKLMNELIKITEENGQRAVSARELHLFLEVQSKFADWIKNRINEIKNQKRGDKKTCFYDKFLHYLLKLEINKLLLLSSKIEQSQYKNIVKRISYRSLPF